MSSPTMRLQYTGVAQPSGRWHATGRHAQHTATTRVRSDGRGGPGWIGPTAPLPMASPPTGPSSAAPVSWPPDLPIGEYLREQVVLRMRRVSVRHTQHAWDRRRQDPISPHAVVFCYADPGPASPHPHGSPEDAYRLPRDEVRIATRLFLDGPEAADLHQVLYDLAALANQYGAAGGLDPRMQMADRCEPMSPASLYLGVGVSTLDTPGQSWIQTQQLVDSVVDVPGQCLAYLADGTMLSMDRGGHGRLGRFSAHVAYSGRSARQPDRPADLQNPSAWHWLELLHQVIAETHRGPR